MREERMGHQKGQILNCYIQYKREGSDSGCQK